MLRATLVLRTFRVQTVVLDPINMYHHGPRHLNIAQKAMLVRTFRSPVLLLGFSVNRPIIAVLGG